jgi:hypothetical protein
LPGAESGTESIIDRSSTRLYLSSMRYTYVIAAYRRSDDPRDERRSIEFVSDITDYDRKEAPKEAVAALGHIDHFKLKKWNTRQAAHQWLKSNEPHILHEEKYSFRTTALQFKVMRLPAWLVDNQTPPPKKVPGLKRK